MINKLIEFLKNKKVIIILIFILAILNRTYMWPNTINDINCDEAMTAINAKAIAETGCDMYGTKMPVYFETWLVGGQSSFLTYFMAICIKIFGFSIFSIRLPMLMMSILSIFVFYKLIDLLFENDKITIITLAVLAINPWHIMQSVWALDCNMFPHIFLIAVYFLLKSIKENKTGLLYVSMLFFGLCTYSYGVALYSVPIFLVIFMLLALKNNKITFQNLTISAIVVLIVTAPLLLMAYINIKKTASIQLGLITIPSFKYFNRTRDIIFFCDNKLVFIKNNIIETLKMLIYNYDGLEWDAIKGFGTLYNGSFVLAMTGLLFLISNKKILVESKNIVLSWFSTSIIIGLIINSVNICRINILWYIMIILIGYGIYSLIENINFKRTMIAVFIVFFTFNYISFGYKFITYSRYSIPMTATWSKGLKDAVDYVVNSNVENPVMERAVLSDDKNITFFIYFSNHSFKTDGFLNKNIYIYARIQKDDKWLIRPLFYNEELDDINSKITLQLLKEKNDYESVCIINKNSKEEIDKYVTYNKIKQFGNYYIIEK